MKSSLSNNTVDRSRVELKIITHSKEFDCMRFVSNTCIIHKM